MSQHQLWHAPARSKPRWSSQHRVIMSPFNVNKHIFSKLDLTFIDLHCLATWIKQNLNIECSLGNNIAIATNCAKYTGHFYLGNTSLKPIVQYFLKYFPIHSPFFLDWQKCSQQSSPRWRWNESNECRLEIIQEIGNMSAASTTIAVVCCAVNLWLH